MPAGRFAPTPSGDLHLGNLRTAMLAWLFARSDGSRFLMRVDDLDPVTSRDDVAASQLDDLRAIGLDWDGAVVHQPADELALGQRQDEKQHELGNFRRLVDQEREARLIQEERRANGADRRSDDRARAAVDHGDQTCRNQVDEDEMFGFRTRSFVQQQQRRGGKQRASNGHEHRSQSPHVHR